MNSLTSPFVVFAQVLTCAEPLPLFDIPPHRTEPQNGANKSDPPHLTTLRRPVLFKRRDGFEGVRMAEKSGVKTPTRDHIGAFLISMPLFAAPKSVRARELIECRLYPGSCYDWLSTKSQ